MVTSPDFPLINAAQNVFGGASDVYVAKLTPSGSNLVYSTYLGGSNDDGATSITVDSSGNVYVAGVTMSSNFRTANPLQATHRGGVFDAFVAKLNPGGTQFIYSTYLGGSGEDRCFRIAVDSSGNAFVTGDTDSTNFPLVNPLQPNKAGVADAFITKLNPTGSALIYSTYLGGSGLDSGFGIAADTSGNAYVMGVTDSVDFPAESPMQAAYGGGVSDVFVVKISSGPAIEGADIEGKNLLVRGSGFDQGAKILIDGQQQKTKNDNQNPAGLLIGKKAGKKIKKDKVVKLQIRNSDGVLSNELDFRRP